MTKCVVHRWVNISTVEDYAIKIKIEKCAICHKRQESKVLTKKEIQALELQADESSLKSRGICPNCKEKRFRLQVVEGDIIRVCKGCGEEYNTDKKIVVRRGKQ